MNEFKIITLILIVPVVIIEREGKKAIFKCDENVSFLNEARRVKIL